MKTKKLKLSLNKMTVAKISNSEVIKGGSDMPDVTRNDYTCRNGCVSNLCQYTGPAFTQCDTCFNC